jgi:hypothetical protein
MDRLCVYGWHRCSALSRCSVKNRASRLRDSEVLLEFVDIKADVSSFTCRLTSQLCESSSGARSTTALIQLSLLTSKACSKAES